LNVVTIGYNRVTEGSLIQPARMRFPERKNRMENYFCPCCGDGFCVNEIEVDAGLALECPNCGSGLREMPTLAFGDAALERLLADIFGE